MANREIEAILKISSRMGSMAALKTLQRELRQTQTQATAFNRSQMAMTKANGLAYASMSRLLAPGLVGYGAARMFGDFATLERRMTRIGITADASSEKTKAALGDIQTMAKTYAMPVNQALEGMEALVAAGRDMESAMAFLPSVMATAQAAGADVADIATTADAVGNSFEIAGDKMQGAFDILVAAGKAGKFELKDMAQYLPSLAPAWAALGYTGEEALRKLAAALQVVRDRTGSSSEAATAMQNVIQKMASNETQNRFKKNFGIDLRRELERAKKDGKDILETFLDLTTIATKGDLSKLPQIFSDAQLQVGVRALMAGRQNMRGLIQDLKSVDGTAMRDLNRVLEDSQTKIDRMATAWGKMKTAMGSAIAPAATGAMQVVLDKIDYDAAIAAALTKEGKSQSEIDTYRARNWLTPSGRRELAIKAVEGGYNMDKQVLPTLAMPTEGPNFAAAAHAGGRPAYVGDVPVPMPRPARSSDEAAAPVKKAPEPQPGSAADRSVVPLKTMPDERPAYVDGVPVPMPAPRRRPGSAPTATPNAPPVDIELPELHYPKMAPYVPITQADLRGAEAGGDASRLEFLAAAAGESLKQSGDDAGRAISEGGESVAQGGKEAAAALIDAAGILRAAVGALQSFGASFRGGSLPPAGPVSGNPGRTMPNAGTASASVP